MVSINVTKINIALASWSCCFSHVSVKSQESSGGVVYLILILLMEILTVITNKPLQGMALTECTPSACLLPCFLACLPACLFACSSKCSPMCFPKDSQDMLVRLRRAALTRLSRSSSVMSGISLSPTGGAGTFKTIPLLTPTVGLKIKKWSKNGSTGQRLSWVCSSFLVVLMGWEAGRELMGSWQGPFTLAPWKNLVAISSEIRRGNGKSPKIDAKY